MELGIALRALSINKVALSALRVVVRGRTMAQAVQALRLVSDPNSVHHLLSESPDLTHVVGQHKSSD